MYWTNRINRSNEIDYQNNLVRNQERNNLNEVKRRDRLTILDMFPNGQTVRTGPIHEAVLVVGPGTIPLPEAVVTCHRHIRHTVEVIHWIVKNSIQLYIVSPLIQWDRIDEATYKYIEQGSARGPWWWAVVRSKQVHSFCISLSSCIIIKSPILTRISLLLELEVTLSERGILPLYYRQ